MKEILVQGDLIVIISIKYIYKTFANACIQIRIL